MESDTMETTKAQLEEVLTRSPLPNIEAWQHAHHGSMMWIFEQFSHRLCISFDPNRGAWAGIFSESGEMVCKGHYYPYAAGTSYVVVPYLDKRNLEELVCILSNSIQKNAPQLLDLF